MNSPPSDLSVAWGVLRAAVRLFATKLAQATRNALPDAETLWNVFICFVMATTASFIAQKAVAATETPIVCAPPPPCTLANANLWNENTLFIACVEFFVMIIAFWLGVAWEYWRSRATVFPAKLRCRTCAANQSTSALCAECTHLHSLLASARVVMSQ